MIRGRVELRRRARARARRVMRCLTQSRAPCIMSVVVARSTSRRPGENTRTDNTSLPSRT